MPPNQLSPDDRPQADLPPRPPTRLGRQLGLAVHLVPGCDAASVTVASAGPPVTVAATDRVARAGDDLQYRLNEGPCVDALKRRLLVESIDLVADPRWPRWSTRVVGTLEVNAMISAPFHPDSGTPGSLNLYARRPSAWDADSPVLATAIAHLLTTTLTELSTTGPHALAILGSTPVGRAQLIVMDRYGIDAEQALLSLCRAARGRGATLSDLAARYVGTFG